MFSWEDAHHGGFFVAILSKRSGSLPLRTEESLTLRRTPLHVIVVYSEYSRTLI